MKNLSKILFTVTLLFLIVSVSFAQMPQYYNYSTTTGGNTFPFNIAAGKLIQFLYLPGDFNQPAPVPPGNKIVKFWFKHTSTGTGAYTDFTIKMKQDTITSLPTGAFYTVPMDTVFHLSTFYDTANAGSWSNVTLQTPYNYDPTKSLIVEIYQCGAVLTGTMSTAHTSITGANRRTYNQTAGGCNYIYQGQGAQILHAGVDVVPAAPPYTVPDLLYYRFKFNTATTTPNFAFPGVGTNPATLTGTNLVFTSGGQFDSCVSGTGATGSHINSNWATNFGSGSWTISMWLNNLPVNTTLYYLFEEATGQFRCFLGGAAGAGNLLLRGTGVTDVNVPSVAPGPTVVHFVYDSATAKISAYKNGVFALSVNQTPLNLATGTNFQVAGYSTLAGLNGLMDEFRVYRRKLDSAEIANTWNIELTNLPTSITPLIEVPDNFRLYQNYPNPFNPETKIKFSIEKSGIVKLTVFDIVGREVAKLVNSNMNKGTYEVVFDASGYSSGMYFYKLESNGMTDTKKMMFIK